MPPEAAMPIVYICADRRHGPNPVRPALSGMLEFMQPHATCVSASPD
jgi:hypothetical protein